MNDQPNPNPAPDAGAAVAAALVRRGDAIDPAAVGQLQTLLAHELAGLPAHLVNEVIDAKLGRPEYARFLAAGAAPPAQQAAAQQAPEQPEHPLLRGLRATLTPPEGGLPALGLRPLPQRT